MNFKISIALLSLSLTLGACSTLEHLLPSPKDPISAEKKEFVIDHYGDDVVIVKPVAKVESSQEEKKVTPAESTEGKANITPKEDIKPSVETEKRRQIVHKPVQ